MIGCIGKPCRKLLRVARTWRIELNSVYVISGRLSVGWFLLLQCPSMVEVTQRRESMLLSCVDRCLPIPSPLFRASTVALVISVSVVSQWATW